MTLDELRTHQRDRLRRCLEICLDSNPFYRRKLGPLGLTPETFELEHLDSLPLTTKQELVEDQRLNPPFGTDLAYPLDRYVRVHQTSGTTGRPLRWLDTADSWSEYLRSWQRVYRAIGLEPDDRVFVAFSFGPFIGFWGAFEAAQQLGALTLTGGALSTEERVRQIVELEVTVVVCTPTYALRMAEVASQIGVDLASSPARITLHAGEPGASLPAVIERLEDAWGARCWDHVGATELGAWGYPGSSGRMFVDEERFVAELIDPDTGDPVPPEPEGARGELVLTNLGRLGSPLLRYRTGDLVHLVPGNESEPRTWLRRGVLGRVDDMFVVRGVNVFPSAIDDIVRGVDGIAEYRATVRRRVEMTEVELEVEPLQGVQGDNGKTGDVATKVSKALRERLSLRVSVREVEPGSLPRWELKAKRFVFED